MEAAARDAVLRGARAAVDDALRISNAASLCNLALRWNKPYPFLCLLPTPWNRQLGSNETPSVSGGPAKDRSMSAQVVLITGALTGIGRATAVAFAKKGAKVVVAGRRDEAGKALVKELRSFGSEAEFINADVRREDDVRALVNQTVARFGRLDVAVNNAGTEGKVGPITDQTAESYAATFDTNVLGVILSMKHEVRVMQKQGSGSIINISSTYGHEAAAGASIYVGRKPAGEGLTNAVRQRDANAGSRV